MVARQIPTPQIFGDLEAMSHAKVPAEGLPAKPALETNDLVALDLSPDRHCWCSSCLRRDRFPELADRLLHSSDQPRQLIRRKGMITDIACDDLCYVAQINALGCVVAVHDASLPADSFSLPLHTADVGPEKHSSPRIDPCGEVRPSLA